MSLLDIIVLVVVLLSGVLAFARGMIKELLSLIGWLAAALAVLYGLPVFRPLARQVIAEPTVSDIVAGGLIFVVVLVLFALASGKISEKVKKSHFGALDRTLGLLFGVARGFVLLSLAYLLLTNWVFKPDEQPQWVESAQTRPVLQAGADILIKLAPSDFLSRGQKAVDKIKKKASELNRDRELLKRLAPRSTAQNPTDSGAAKGYTKKQRSEMNRAVDRIK